MPFGCAAWHTAIVRRYLQSKYAPAADSVWGQCPLRRYLQSKYAPTPDADTIQCAAKPLQTRLTILR
jgi:hypothetical protein